MKIIIIDCTKRGMINMGGYDSIRERAKGGSKGLLMEPKLLGSVFHTCTNEVLHAYSIVLHAPMEMHEE
jgi:hypothetical protein